MTNPGESGEAAFAREERFIVVKRKHLSTYQEIALREHMKRWSIVTVECVVVESDWPEYETVWRMIEDRVTGATTRPEPAGVGVRSLLARFIAELTSGGRNRNHMLTVNHDALMSLVHEAREAIALLPASGAGEWHPIETAPKWRQRILGWNAEYGMRETCMMHYQVGSPGFAQHGPAECGWEWLEEKHNSVHRWEPTHWQPLPAPPALARPVEAQ